MSGATTRPQRPRRQRAVRKSQLSPARQWLVENMQKLAYGRFKHLIIVNGDPLISPPPRRYRDRRLTGANGGRREAALADFVLKQRLVALFDELDRIGNGVIAVLEVRDGLPYGMTLEESDRA